IISSDRGLCGGLNINLFKNVVLQMRQWHQQGVEVDLCTIGAKSMAFFKRFGGHIVAQASHLGDAPHVQQLIGIVKVMLDAYDEGKIDQLYVAYNQFINTMSQKPRVEQLLPVTAPAEEDAKKHYWDYIYEPDAREVLNELLMRYIESLVYQGVVENLASEQAARMVAMKSASDNAGNLIDELQLAYNKARQAAITQEISEIVGGAAAV
ncbi:MAG: ATP synthase F1 subunit gamma, partial [Gammaproteobacteria bacterium]|nr:ATP synthase F1 subunit gamma [Gammaproteobacteria bacterium]